MAGAPNRRVAVGVYGVDHVYRGGIRALSRVTVEILRGEFVAIIGTNGSGKTTLSKHFNGLLKPTNPDGQVLVQPERGRTLSTRDVPLHRMASVVGYVFQNPDRQLFHDTCREELEFGLRNLGVDPALYESAVRDTLSLVGLPGDEDSNISRMSRGQRQRLAIAASLVMDPEVAVVDEPTTGQDRRESYMILDLLQRFHASGKTVVLISHNMALVAEYATRVIAMRAGTILADGTPREVFAIPEILRSTNIRPPQVTVLGSRLGLPGLLNVPEAVRAISEQRIRADS